MNLNWLKKLWNRNRLTISERKADRWKHETVKLVQSLVSEKLRAINAVAVWEKKLSEHQKNINEAFNRCEKRSREIDKKVDYANRLIERHVDVQESLESELKILKDIVIPELSLANESIRVQMEADIACQAHRQAAYAPPIPSGKE